MGTYHISGTAEARVVKLCMYVGYVESQHDDDISPLKGCGQILVIGKAIHFKFRVLIDIEGYECMTDTLLPKGMCSESRDLFKFWEVSDNVSETVQNNRYRYIDI